MKLPAMKKSSNSGPSRFIKLKNGESIQGVFMGEPLFYEQHWTGSESVECEGANCVYCEAGQRPTEKFRFNFVTKENDTLVSKVFEKGNGVYEIIRGLSEDYDLERTVMKISRRGSGKHDTVYTISPLPENKLSEMGVEQVKAVVLQDLAPRKQSDIDQQDTTDSD